MTNTDRYSSTGWRQGNRDENKRLTLSVFLYPCSLFVVCFVRVFLMLVCRICSVFPSGCSQLRKQGFATKEEHHFCAGVGRGGYRSSLVKSFLKA